MNKQAKSESNDSEPVEKPDLPGLDEVNVVLISRSLYGGILMGLANLVPGISGGTMLLAAGIYPRFISAIAEITRFRFRFHSLLILGCVAMAGGLSILVGAGLLKDLVVNHRWVMYSLFIGLTLGGIPVVWKIAKPATTSLAVAAVLSFLAMVILAILQTNNVVGSGGSNTSMLFLAGLAGASAMILPGLSGGYILLLMGQYVPILSAIDQFKEAIKARDFAGAMDPALAVLFPVGIGLLAGVIVIGNLLQWLLKHYQKPTLGLLLGLLIGSVAGIYPFQTGVEPKPGDTVKGQLVTHDDMVSSRIDQEDWPVEYFTPRAGQVGWSILLIGLGMGTTMGVAKLGPPSSHDKSKRTS